MDAKAFICALSAVCATFAADAAERRPMALMVFFDGGRADCLMNARCPALCSLVDGTWADGYRCAWSDAGRNLDGVGTYSYANHASILCSVPPEEHGLRFNSWVPMGRFRKNPAWLRMLTDRGVSTAAFYADRTDGTLTRDGVVEVCVATNGWRTADGDIAELAAARLSRPDAPQASNLFFESPDVQGHYFGYYPSSEEYLAAFDRSDAYLGKALDAIRARPTFAEEDWMIVFTTDHGGKGVRHGPDTGHCHTVPILVVSRHVAGGRLPGTPRTYDLVPTLLAHFGVEAPTNLMGRALGEGVRELKARSLEDGLVFREDFDAAFPHEYYVADDFAGMVTSGYTNNLSVSDGVGTMHGRDEPCSFWMRKAAGAFKGAFTVSWWMVDSGAAYDDNPPVLGNRNNHDDFVEETGHAAPGFTVFLKSPTDPGGKGVTLEYPGADGAVRRLGAFTSCVGKWTFYAIVNRGDGAILFYQGRPDGRLNWIADAAPGARLHSGLDPAFGQDGTAEHHIGFDGSFDTVRVWTRDLSSEEVRKVFMEGRR